MDNINNSMPFLQLTPYESTDSSTKKEKSKDKYSKIFSKSIEPENMDIDNLKTSQTLTKRARPSSNSSKKQQKTEDVSFPTSENISEEKDQLTASVNSDQILRQIMQQQLSQQANKIIMDNSLGGKTNSLKSPQELKEEDIFIIDSIIFEENDTALKHIEIVANHTGNSRALGFLAGAKLLAPDFISHGIDADESLDVYNENSKKASFASSEPMNKKPQCEKKTEQEGQNVFKSTRRIQVQDPVQQVIRQAEIPESADMQTLELALSCIMLSDPQQLETEG